MGRAITSCWTNFKGRLEEGLKLGVGVEGADHLKSAPGRGLSFHYFCKHVPRSSSFFYSKLFPCPTPVHPHLPTLFLAPTPRHSPSRVTRSLGAAGMPPVPCSASSSSCCCRACCKIRRVSRGPTYSSSSVPRPRRFSRAPARTMSPARICSASGACFSGPPAPRAALNLGIFLEEVAGKVHTWRRKISPECACAVNSQRPRGHKGITAPPIVRRPGVSSAPPRPLRARRSWS